MAGVNRRGGWVRWVVVALLVVPLAELLVILQVGDLIGGWPTVLLLVAESALGAYLLGREGPATWRRLQAALGAGRMPSAELTDAALVLVGGTLLLTPGFITDAVGFFCILPPTRPLARRWVLAAFRRRVTARVVPGSGPARGPQRGPGPDDVIEGEIVEE
ncbi:FxsA family protein [Quadrisphaera sp. GCM10027208]|uniref:FxsA family protein n=1 Tax=Quadrisphaera sp. GCM10027208 TaxID=3273423 RepID=UPI003613BED3